MKRLLIMVLATASFLAGACRRDLARAPDLRFDRPSIFLVSIDTLRADLLPDYGSTRITTPAISGLRRGGLLFRDVYSPAPLTLPAHASVFTGLLPFAHHVRDNLGYSLAAGAPTLAETLAGHGYATGGAVSSVVLSGTSGINRGFAFWEDSIDAEFAGQPLNRVQRGGDATRQLLERFVQGEQQKPLFAFLHIYEPHSPYDPGEPFQHLAPTLYEGEILKADAVLGRFLDFLKQQGLYEDSVIIVFSDHGEGLGDHGETEHGVFLYREALHVPLIVKLPRSVRAGQTVDGLCGLDELHDFILDVAGLRQEPSSLASVLSGRSPGRRTVYAESYFGRIHFGWAPLRSLRTASAAYIEAPRGEFFDLTTDPGEQKNRLEEKPDLLRQLVAEMAKVPPSFSGPSGVNEEATKKLASLGYLSAPATSGGLPLDPKDRIGELEKMRRALSLHLAGREREALNLLESLIEENPGAHDLLLLRQESLVGLAKAEVAGGKFEAALTLLDQARPLGGSPPVAGWNQVRGDALARLDRVGEAERAFRAEIDLNPKALIPRSSLAILLAAAGRKREAFRVLDQMREAFGTAEARNLAEKTGKAIGQSLP